MKAKIARDELSLEIDEIGAEDKKAKRIVRLIVVFGLTILLSGCDSLQSDASIAFYLIAPLIAPALMAVYVRQEREQAILNWDHKVIADPQALRVIPIWVVSMIVGILLCILAWGVQGMEPKFIYARWALALLASVAGASIAHWWASTVDNKFK